MIRRMGRPGLIGMAARTAVVVGTANAVSGSMEANQNAKAQTAADAQAFQTMQQQAELQAAVSAAVAAQQPVAASPAPPADDLMSKLTQLGTLHSQGILSDDEFTSAKAKLLA